MAREVFEGLVCSVFAPSGEEIQSDDTGYLGPLGTGSYRLVLEASRDLRVAPFTVNQDSNATASTVQARQDGQVFGRKVPVKSGRQCNYTGYPDNHLCIALLRDAGEVEIWKVGIVSQKGGMSIYAQLSGWCPWLFADSEAIRCPLFENSWQTLTRVLLDAFRPYAAEFPALPPGYDPKQEDEETPELPEGPFAYVQWFELFRGVGGTGVALARDRNGKKRPARLDWDQAPKRNGLRYALQGDLIEYDELVPSNRPGSSLKWEIRGARLAEG